MKTILKIVLIVLAFMLENVLLLLSILAYFGWMIIDMFFMIIISVLRPFDFFGILEIFFPEDKYKP